MKKIAVLFCTCIILIGCTSTPKVDILAEEDALRNIEDQWAVANKAKDINKIVSFSASDGVLMGPNQPIIVGIEAIKKSWELWFSDTTMLWETYSWTSDKIEVSASGDLAYVRGTNRMNIKTPNGIIEDRSKGVDIWKKIDGEWKCVVGIFNSDTINR
jgi:ketosteroid isomerase-like protein